MPRKSTVKCTVVILDCSSNVSDRIKYIYRLASTNFFTESKDAYKVLFFNNGGSRTTQIIRDWSDYNLSNLEELRDEAVELETTYSLVELFEAVETGIECFMDEQGSIPSQFKRIILISDIKNVREPYNQSNLADKLRNVQSRLNNDNIWLFVIGPEVKLPKLSSLDEIEDFAKHIEPAAHLDGECKSAISEFSKIFASGVRGVMCDFENGFCLTFSYSQKQVPSYNYYVDLSIGSNIKIPVNVSRLTKKVPTIKKNLCFHNLETNTDQAWFEKRSHDSVELENVIGGYQFHKKRVILSESEEASFNDESSEKCLSICAFVDADEIRKDLYLMSDNINSIVPDQRQSIGCQRDFCALLEAMRAKKVVGIAKRAYYNKKRPWPFAIFPCPEHEKCLLMGKLPFKHEFHERFIPGKEVKIETDNNQENLFSFLDSMTAKGSDFCDDGKVLHPLAQHLAQNPNRRFGYEYLALKSLDIPSENTRPLTVNTILLDRSEQFVDQLLEDYVDQNVEDDD